MRRRKYHENKKSRNNGSKKYLGLLSVLFILVFVVLGYVFWKIYNLEKFVYVNKTLANDTEVVIIDSVNDREIKYLVPGEMELVSARGYGEYRMSSLWSLSEKEKNSEFVAETITKNFYIPVYLWKDDKGSNLNIYQKIKVFLSEKKNTDYDLVFTSTRLPNSVLVQFVDPVLSQKTPTIEIEDLTGGYNAIDSVSKTIEVMGGKVTSNSKGYDEDLDCEAMGENIKLVKVFSDIFDCEVNQSVKVQSDLKIRLGAKFTERF